MEKKFEIVNKVHGIAMKVDRLIMPSKIPCGCCRKDRLLVDRQKSLYHCECGDIIAYVDLTRDMFGDEIKDIGFQSWVCANHKKRFLAEVRNDEDRHLLTIYEEKIEIKPC